MRKTFENLLSSSSFRDASVISIAALLIWLTAVESDLYERFHQYIIAHEDKELDEVLIAFLIVGLAGYVFAIRRLLDLKKEAKARSQAEIKARWIAYHDFLTGLPNRRFFEESSEEHILDNLKSDAYSVIAIDLDGFKQVNDLVGHEGGDYLLKTVSERLVAAFPGEVVVRLGGDEFVVVASGNGRERIREKCSETIHTLTQPMTISGVHVEIGACTGYACYPQDGDSLKSLSLCADIALYAAKREGRNTVKAYQPGMSEQLKRRAELEGSLRVAVRRGEIIPHYQPMVDLQTGEIRGFEALSRWQRNGNGAANVSPATFFPLAEEVGLIVELSEQVLRKACLDAARWHGDVKLSFNLSAALLCDRLIASRILMILSETGLDPARLELEVTENALVRDVDLASEIFAALQAEGITIALDDFGTGYSSLSQLSKISFDKIKIDRSFINSFEQDETKYGIVKTMISLAHGLGIDTVAEGLETEGQLLKLKELGCKYAQGFLYSEAVPASQVETLMEEFALSDIKSCG